MAADHFPEAAAEHGGEEVVDNGVDGNAQAVDPGVVVEDGQICCTPLGGGTSHQPFEVERSPADGEHHHHDTCGERELGRELETQTAEQRQSLVRNG
ncbi:unnamed protein product [Caretta caretta]